MSKLQEAMVEISKAIATAENEIVVREAAIQGIRNRVELLQDTLLNLNMAAESIDAINSDAYDVGRVTSDQDHEEDLDDTHEYDDTQWVNPIDHTLALDDTK